MENIAIEVKNIAKIYKLYDKSTDRLKESLNFFHKKYHKEFFALKDISFDISKGDTVGIIGKNGSGKSTLLKIITGILTPSNGEVNVHGKVSALLELGAGFNPEYTGIENIYLNGTIMGYSKLEIDSKLNDILSFADIGDFIHQPVKTYSSGMFARLAFAVAINVDPDILIVDEALSVGDMEFQNKCFNKIQQLMINEKTILFVSHNLSAIRLFCKKVIWINEGSLVMYDNTDVVTDMYEKELKNYNIISDTIPPKSNILNVNELEGNFKDKGEILSNSMLWFDNVQIYNTSGKISYNFNTGEKIVIRFIIVNKTNSYQSISLGLSFTRSDGIEICRINNIRDDLPIVLKDEVNYINCEINTIELLTGEYLLSYYLAKDNIIEAYHKVENTDRICITTPFAKCGWRKYDGIVAIKHNWR